LTLKGTGKGFILAETLVSIVLDTFLLAIFFLIFTLFWNVFVDQNNKANPFLSKNLIPACFRQLYLQKIYLCLWR
jgi:hypothetical protein